MKSEGKNDFIFSVKSLIKNNDIYSILTGIYIFSWFTQIGKRIQFLDSIRFELLLGSLLTISSIYILSTRVKRRIESNVGTIAIILIIYYGIFSFLTYAPETSWFIYFNRVVKFSLMSFFIYALADNIHKIAFILFCYFLAAAKAGQEGLIGWVTGNMIWENQGIPRLHGSLDMYGHPNSFSGFAVSLLPFIYCFYPLMNKYMKLGLIFLGVCVVVILLFTGSRTGYFAASCLLFYVLIKTFRKSFLKVAIIGLSLTIITTTLLPDAYKGRFESIFTQKDQEGGSAIARKQILIDGIEIFLTHPFGVGISAFPKVRGDTFGRSQDTHNLYLQVLTNTGFIGLILFLFFVSSIIKTNRRSILLHRANDSYESKFIIAASSAIIGYVWARLLLGLFGMDMYEIYWWFALGITLAAQHIPHKVSYGSPSNQICD